MAHGRGWRIAPQLAALVVLAACGGGGGSSGGGNGTPTVVISAGASSVGAGGAAVSLQASFSGGATGPVAWSLTSDGTGDPGTVTSTSATTGSYTPPAAAASAFHVTIKGTAAGGVSGSTVLTVSPAGSSPAITVTAGSATAVAGGATVQLTAALTGGASGPIAWSLTSDGIGDAGTVVGSGATSATYTPPAVLAATIHVTLKATGAGGVFGTTAVAVSPAAGGTVTLSPATRTLYAGDAPVSFNAKLAGGASGDVVWSLQSAAADPGALVQPDPTGWCGYRPPASLASAIDVTLTATVGTVVGHAQIHVVPVAGPARVVVTPPSQAILAGSAAVQLTATLVAGATGPISWTANAGAPGTITADATGETATYTPPASVSGATVVTLTATPIAGASANGTVTVLAASDGKTVTGKVLSQSGRQPVAGAVAQIGTATATTGLDGTFTFTGVAVPYTLAVSADYSPSFKYTTIRVIEGVTTIVPEVLIDVATSPVSTTVSGGFANSTIGYFPIVSIAGPGVDHSGGSYSPVDYSADISITPPVTLTLRALEMNSGGLYGRFASRTLAMATADPVTAATITYGDSVATGSISGTFQARPNAMQASLTKEAQFGAYRDGDVFQMGSLSSPSAFTTAVPILPGATGLWLAGLSYSQTEVSSLRRKVMPGDTGISMILPAPPRPAAPADAAQLNASGALVWDGSGVSAVTISCTSATGGSLLFEVLTAAASARIPALQGLSPASGGTCTWSVGLRDDGRTAGAAVDPAAAEPSFVAEASASASRSVATP